MTEFFYILTCFVAGCLSTVFAFGLLTIGVMAMICIVFTLAERWGLNDNRH
jgi:dolichol kinase